MNLGISPVRYNSCPSFGMAKFTVRGRALAQTQADIFEAFESPTEYQNPEFFRKVAPFKKTPFSKYIEKEGNTGEIFHIVTECGDTGNAILNAKFVKQLLASKKTISKTREDVQDTIRDALGVVFTKNWDNPLLSKKETLELLEMTGLPDKTIVAATGVIQKCDAK